MKALERYQENKIQIKMSINALISNSENANQEEEIFAYSLRKDFLLNTVVSANRTISWNGGFVACAHKETL